MAVDAPAVIEGHTIVNLGNIGWNLYNPDVVALCKDVVADSSSDYFLFQYDFDEYLLVVCKDIWDNLGTYDLEAPKVYDIFVQTLTPEQMGGKVVNPEKGVISGHVSGVDAQADVYSEDITATLQFYPNRTFLQMYQLDTSGVEHIWLTNTSHTILYSSMPGFAKLHSSESHYLYLLSAVAVGACLFGLLRSVFKRLY